MNILIIFTVLTIFNVVLATIKSIVTIKSGKVVASLVSAGYYGFYTIMLIYTVAEFPLWQKVIVTFLCNLVGVFAVKWAEEKARKDRLWKVEATFKKEENFIHNLEVWAEISKISFNYIDINKFYVVNFYCPTQNDSSRVKEFVKKFNGKYFVTESKNL